MKGKSLKKSFVFTVIKIVVTTLLSIILVLSAWIIWTNIFPRDYYDSSYYPKIKKEVLVNKRNLISNKKVVIDNKDTRFAYGLYYKGKLIKYTDNFKLYNTDNLIDSTTSDSFVNDNLTYRVELLKNDLKIIAIYPAFSTGNSYIDIYNGILQNLLLVSPLFLFVCSLIYYTSKLYKNISNNFDDINSYLKYVEDDNLENDLRSFEEKEFQELSNSINLMKSKLKVLLVDQQEKIRIQNNLFSSLAHDIKTPLTIISAESEMLSLTHSKNKNSENRYDIIFSEISRIDKLVTELLTISKLNRYDYTLDIEKIDLKITINNLLREFNSLLIRKNIQVKFNISSSNFYIERDKLIINRVLQNIISNALEHIMNNGTLKIEIEKKNKKINLIISNTGSQFPEDYLNSEFIPFYSSKRQRDKKHFGLGLYMSNIMLSKINSQLFIQNKNNCAVVTISFNNSYL
ncbi:sensor histidine kinase [Macrococcus epidermidis]|uniref:sensor histidine kinase n=1 Tax=Macrococcus epidermidis TaxID=1902580 RepID=UPI0020B7E6C0|nr:HAMP domain-containing sensor histidine kinase [Macrococcus epidermidis]UTH16276.1 HAMP domain-containing histidine kinase [Macrococcus epidermidis]